MQTADWYFDVISPYAYFGLLRLAELSNDLEIRYRPVLFAGLFEHWGQKGPAEIPTKRSWTSGGMALDRPGAAGEEIDRDVGIYFLAMRRFLAQAANSGVFDRSR